MTLRITDTTDTHSLTMFPKELKIGGKKKLLVPSQLWSLEMINEASGGTC